MCVSIPIDHVYYTLTLPSDFVMEFAPFGSLSQLMIKNWGLRTLHGFWIMQVRDNWS